MSKPPRIQTTNTTCIDLIVTKNKDVFKNSNVLEGGTSKHHSFITTVLRSQLVNQNTKFIKIIKALTSILSEENSKSA